MSPRTLGPIESIGATVRFWREQRGWTRTRLAAETRIPLPTISDIESGWEGVNAAQLRRIWGALGIYATWIITPIKEEA
ncbi:hypothetical protein SEA_BRAN_59 [Corynebacterium phage Bran]|nr:hypothetical protein SEA_BRAN_59 [Corynebacterium phage Bran]